MVVSEPALTVKRRAGVKRHRKILPRIDMTPMVDLGFLLITFFVITAQMSQPVVTRLVLPKPGAGMPVAASDVLTVIITGDQRLWYYEGEWDRAVKSNAVYQTDLSPNGLRTIIIQKKRQLENSVRPEKGKGLLLIMKAGEQANYGSVIDLLDEVMINGLKKYAMVAIDPAEAAWLAQRD